jgi:acetyl esterase/lipase
MRLRALALATTLVALVSPAPVCNAQAPQTTLPLWPPATPGPPPPTDPETDTTKPTDNFISGHRTARLTNVTAPTLSVYPPHDHNTGSAALVFPGGGYQILAWDGEGLDPCHWLNSLGMTCLLVKYRVPQPTGEAGHYPADPSDLEDAQQAMRLARAHAADWHIDPTRIGVMGFSAGANLAVLLSTHPDDHHVESTPAAPDVDTHIDARADFAIIVYPAYLALPPDQTALDPTYTPNSFTPPTFLIQAENDKTYVRNSLVYYRALLDANVPAELHLYAGGGHGFGMNPIGAPEEHWPRLAANWLRTLNIIPPEPHHTPSGPSTGASIPCPLPQPPPPGRPTNASSNTSTATNATTETNPNCW